MDKIALLPLFFAILLISKKDLIWVFTYFFIPVIIFLPTYYETKIIQGLPELTFYTAALLPLFVITIIKSNNFEFKFRLLDFLILFYIFFIFLAQFYNSDYKVAQKLLFNETMAKFAGYFLIRCFYVKKKDRYNILKVFLLCASIEAILTLIEFRMWNNLIDDSIRKIWPSRVAWDMPMVRSGFKRAYGTLGHPIVLGYFFAMLFPISLYVHNHKNYGHKNWTLLASMLMVMGCISSISRAPISGLVICALILWYGWSKKKILTFTIMTTIFITLGIVFLPKIIAYVSVDRMSAETEDQRNAAYRKELLDNYLDIVDERPLLGWGRFTVPWLDDQISIDNEYLFLALTHGKLSVFIYLLLVSYVFFRLVLHVFQKKHKEDSKRLAWALITAIFTAMFIQTTVWNGFQITPIFFMFLGIAENVLYISEGSSKDDSSDNSRVESIKSNNEYSFSRTI